MRRLWVLPLLVWSLVFSVLGFTSSAKPIGGDARLMCASAQALWHEGTFAVPRLRNDVVPGPDGQLFVKYPLLTVLQCVPAVMLSDLAAKVVPGDEALAALAPALVPHAVAATLAVGALLLALELNAGWTASVWFALIVSFCSPIWVSSRSLDSEPLQAALTVWTILMAVRARDETRRAAFFWAGVLCGLALNTKIILCILPIALLVDQLHERITRTRLRSALYALPGALLGIAAFLWYNHTRFGDMFAQGYSVRRDEALGFSVPLASGLYGLLFSSGKSVFQYTPVLLASLWAVPHWFRERRRDLWLIAIPTVFTLLVISKWWAWHGDWGWGSRLLLPVVPLACVPALTYLAKPTRRARNWLIVLAAAGCYVQLLALTIAPSDYLNVVRYPGKVSMGKHPDAPEVRDPLLLAHFIPEFNPIVAQQWLLVLYFERPPFSIESWHPWQSLGVRSWRPRRDPSPQHLNYWLDRKSSPAALAVEAAFGVLILALSSLLIRRVRSVRRSLSPPPPP